MRVVLDANVVIAAFASHGLCKEVYELCVRNHDVLLCEHLAGEIQKGFLKKIKMPKAAVGQNLEFIRSNGSFAKPVEVPPHSCRDPKDLPILGLAQAGQADYLITGDEDFVVLKKFGKTAILSPRGFWEIAKKQKGPKKQ